MTAGPLAKRLLGPSLLLALVLTGSAASADKAAPGGWVEPQGSPPRARWSASFVQQFVPPRRGPFTFPAPYRTEAVRITEPSDCGGKDCVWYVGYSYWRNSNAHRDRDEMYILLGLAKERGGAGPTLFTYDKRSDRVTNTGPLFPPESRFAARTGEGWYFSAGRPTTLYVNDGPRMLRYDVVSRRFETVFDVEPAFGTNRNIYQMHSSDDDLVHSATLRVASTEDYLGCLVYFEAERRFRWYPKIGLFDECHLERSGRWTVSLEDIGEPGDIANRLFDNRTGQETRLAGPNGTVGHMDVGYGYLVGADDHLPLPHATIRIDFEPAVAQGPILHRNSMPELAALNHPSHLNARPHVPLSSQYTCGSNATVDAFQNEITCVRLDGSTDQLIVAPVMNDLQAPGGCCDAYGKMPKGNLDVTGAYFIWTTNLGGDRLDAYLVKVPAHRLISESVSRADVPH